MFLKTQRQADIACNVGGDVTIHTGLKMSQINRSWARTPQASELEGPPGLPLSGQAPKGALPSPPYSEEVDLSFRQQHQHNRQGASPLCFSN